ncbi:MAG: SDR family NAD(P)-dependent oxidoreductase [Chloroflexota bacterium]
MSTAMIWGANGGIGRALVKQLIAAGWTVLAVTHTPTNLDGLTPHVFDADAGAPYDVHVAISAASQVVDEINLWIYTAGDITQSKVNEMEIDTWQRIMDANLTGAFITTRYSLPLLAEDAHIFFVGAIHERLRLPRLSAYAAAKAGLEAFAETLRKEERKKRVTVVRPGAVATPFWEKTSMKLPTNALTADTVASGIISAYETKQKGNFDLTP